MSNPDRIPRPRHLFPEMAALLIQGKRGLLRVKWGLRDDHDWFPAWSIGSIAGVSGVLLAVLLFFMKDPHLAAAPADPNTIAPLKNDPVVVPVLTVDQFPALQPARSSLFQSTLVRTQLPYVWDQTEVAVRESRPKRMQEPFIKDFWTTTDQYRSVNDTFRPYFIQGATVPIAPSYVTASAHRTIFDGVESTREQGLLIEKLMRSETSTGAVFTYEIHVTNRTNDPIDHVVVRERLPAIQRVSKVVPPAAVQGDELVWSLGRLPGREMKRLVVTLIPDSAEKIETVTTVENVSRVGGIAKVSPPAAAELPEPELLPVEPDEAVLPVFDKTESALPAVQPEQKVEPAKKPEEIPAPVTEVPLKFPKLQLAVSPMGLVKKGEIVSLTFTVTNVGTAVAEDIALYVDLSDELKHKYGEKVTHRITRLEPGQSRRALFQATAREAGTGELLTSLTMQGNEEKAEKINVLIEASREKISRRNEPTPVECQRPDVEIAADFTQTQWRRFNE